MSSIEERIQKHEALSQKYETIRQKYRALEQKWANKGQFHLDAINKLKAKKAKQEKKVN